MNEIKKEHCRQIFFFCVMSGVISAFLVLAFYLSVRNTDVAIKAKSLFFDAYYSLFRKSDSVAVNQELASIKNREFELAALDKEARMQSIGLYGFEGREKNIQKFIGDDNKLGYLYSDIDFIFEEDSRYCPSVNHSFVKIIGKNRKTVCYRLIYKNLEQQFFSVLVKSNAAKEKRKLIIYNHGHNGLPSKDEKFASQFLEAVLAKGFDILLVSMPFTGLDIAKYNFKFKSWDGESTADAVQIDKNFQYTHGVFRLMDTGSSHFMRYFIDSGVITAVSLRNKYSSISYVGLSGGASTGLYTCTVLESILNHCLLVSGVMPMNLRSNADSFGDAEQVSASFSKRNNIFDLVRGLAESKVDFRLYYSSDDSCCFRKESANAFRKQLEKKSINVPFVIRNSNEHGYDGRSILQVLSADNS